MDDLKGEVEKHHHFRVGFRCGNGPWAFTQAGKAFKIVGDTRDKVKNDGGGMSKSGCFLILDPHITDKISLPYMFHVVSSTLYNDTFPTYQRIPLTSIHNIAKQFVMEAI